MSNPVDLLTEKTKSQTALADLMGVTPQAITKWRNNRIPAERVLEIERLTGVSRHCLRPDIYPPPAAA
jgi:DNA-binding transcriptional regulator YdaS (Cro superfamily)